MATSKRLLFGGGGSGGHLAPLLSVLEAVQAKHPEIECHYAGLKSDLDSQLLKDSSLKFIAHPMTAGKLHRFVTWKQWGEGGRMLAGLWRADRLLARIKPARVFVKGGFVGVPLALAAARRGIPVYSHEGDAVMGLANRIVARFAKTIFTTYPVHLYTGLPLEKLRFTGQPVRAVFYQHSDAPLCLNDRQIKKDEPLITVIGGSQGARRINYLVKELWPVWLKAAQLVQVCGSLDRADLEEAAGQLAPDLREKLLLTSFVGPELPLLLQRSTVVISRAGSTIAELAACRKAAILLPLSTGAQGHQMANGRLLEEEGAAIVLDETKTTASELNERLMELLTSDLRRRELEMAIGRLDHPQAAAIIAASLTDGL